MMFFQRADRIDPTVQFGHNTPIFIIPYPAHPNKHSGISIWNKGLFAYGAERRCGITSFRIAMIRTAILPIADCVIIIPVTDCAPVQ